MSRYPSRKEILAAVASEPRGVPAQELMERFAVEASLRPGFLRLLDSLAFEGILVAKSGDRFSMRGGAREAEETPTAARKAGKPSKADRPARSGVDSPEKAAEPAAPRTKSVKPVKAPFREEAAPMPQFSVAGPAKPTQKRSGVEAEGTLTANARGFGFVAVPGEDDVFIPEESLGGAMHGDRVRILVTGRNSRGAEGVITGIVARGRIRVSGILRRRGKSAWIEPDDTRIRGPIVLATKMDAEGPEGNSGNDGDVCIVQITRHPELQNENPEGKILQVLGRPGVLSVEVQKIIGVAGLEEVHSDEAVAEAEAYGLEVPQAMLAGREDLTHIPLPTIDPEDARDHDDAVWVERTPAGGYLAYIAIADVSSYVTPGSKIDEEAKMRGCSVYLPDRAIPMLPRALSSNLCSLLPDVVRLCLCVVVELDGKGEILKTRITRGFMKSQAKLTYGGVARALGFTEEPPRDPKAEAMIDGLKVANELSRMLRGRRMKRGALDFDLPEAKILWNEDKEPVHVVKRSQDPGMKKAYQLIEELMLLGNEVVATWLVEKNIPSIFRVHLPPDETKLARLAAMCKILGVEFDLEDTKEPRKLAALVKRFGEHENATVLHMLLLRSMKQATYEAENRGHFGLASTAYLHFTSPIRRYPDLVVHRAVHKVVLGQRPSTSEEALEELRESALLASQAERKAMEVERDIMDLYRCVIMKQHLGETFTGLITALVGSGAFVAIDEPFVDVLVRFDAMGQEPFELSDDGLRATAPRSGDSIAIGDAMMVQIMDAPLERRQVLARRLTAGGDGEARPARSDVRGGRGAGGGRSDKGRPTSRSDSKSGRGEGGRGGGRDGGGSGESRKGGKPSKGGAKGKSRSGGGGTSGGGGGGGPKSKKPSTKGGFPKASRKFTKAKKKR